MHGHVFLMNTSENVSKPMSLFKLLFLSTQKYAAKFGKFLVIVKKVHGKFAISIIVI